MKFFFWRTFAPASLVRSWNTKMRALLTHAARNIKRLINEHAARGHLCGAICRHAAQDNICSFLALLSADRLNDQWMKVGVRVRVSLLRLSLDVRTHLWYFIGHTGLFMSVVQRVCNESMLFHSRWRRKDASIYIMYLSWRFVNSALIEPQRSMSLLLRILRQVLN